MAELVEYTSPKAVEGLQPSDLGVSAYEQMGRHIGLTARQLGATVKNDIDEYTQHQAQQEISTDTKNAADAYLGASNDLDKFMSTPEARTNPNAAQDWINNNLQKFLDPIGKDATTDAGKAHAAEVRNSMLMSLARAAHGYQSTVAGQNLQDNLTDTANTLGQMVHDHPDMLDGALSALSISLDKQIAAGTFSPDVAARLRSDMSGPITKRIAMSAVQGAAEVNPAQASADLHSGRFGRYFDGEDMQKLDNFIKSQGNVNDELVRKQTKDAMTGDLTKVQNEITFDEQGNATIPRTFYGDLAKVSAAYAGKPGAEDLPGQVRALFDFAHTKAREAAEGVPAKTDPHTYEDLTTRLLAPAGSPNALTMTDIVRARADGRLSDKDYNFIKESFNALQKDPGGKIIAQQTNDFLKGMKSSITHSNPLMSILDGVGDQRYYDFSVATRAAVQQGMSEGKSINDIFTDIRKNVLPKFQIGTQQGQDIMGEQFGSGHPVNLPAPTATPHKPGQKPADFLKEH